ncbi:MAG TPA: 30S ribosomal protein S12 methylthiotransferase RimO, partial [Trebonia sp.]|nr:30S ribosomal protein S12 methylthiotransferase RimO [Trebonia sp.]
LGTIRAKAPEAGVRSNFIVGFPGETEEDLAELERFLGAARLDAIGVFGYSDEEGTEAAGFEPKVDADEIAARVERVTALADELVAQRAEDRIGGEVAVLVEEVVDGEVIGRAAHQGPEVDGVVRLTGADGVPRGRFVPAVVTAAEGVDLVARADGAPW